MTQSLIHFRFSFTSTSSASIRCFGSSPLKRFFLPTATRASRKINVYLSNLDYSGITVDKIRKKRYELANPSVNIKFPLPSNLKPLLQTSLSNADSITSQDNELPPYIPQTPSGFQPPRPEGPILPNLEFFITRSRTNNLPVYTWVRCLGPRVNTVIRNIHGDKEKCVEFLQKHLGHDVITEVDIKISKIVVRGNRVDMIKVLFYRVGF